MPLSDIVDVTITTESAQVRAKGYGIPLILSATAAFGDRVRAFFDLAELTAAGLGAATPEYKAAQALFSQSPRPEKVLIGRCVNRPTQRHKVTIVLVQNATTYTLKVDGTEVSFTSDANATVDEIRTGLKAAIDALAKPITVTNEIGTSEITITNNAAGGWTRFEVLDVNLLGIVQDHADPGLAADLDAIKAVNDEWYGLSYLFPSAACVTSIAAWVEANGKLYVQTSQETKIITTAAGGATDIAKVLQTAAYMRTAIIYHPDNGAFSDFAWLGKCLPLDPGSETWKFKRLSGVATTNLTPTHVANAKAKNANYYYEIAGVPTTADGKVAGNDWIDSIRGRDWIESGMAEKIFTSLSNAKKVPYTDAGIAVIEAGVRAQLMQAVSVGLIAEDPAFTVTVPKASAALPADKSARILRNVLFEATLAGAIHEIRIQGRVSV